MWFQIIRPDTTMTGILKFFGRMEPGDRSDDPKIADIMPYARRNGIFKDKYF